MESPQTRKKETAQEAFKKLREKSKVEMLERKQKIDDAQERAAIAKSKAKKKKPQDNESEETPGKDLQKSKEKPMPTPPVKEKRVVLPETTAETSEKKPISTTMFHRKSPISTTMFHSKSPSSTTNKSEHYAGDTDRLKTESVQTYSRSRKRHRQCTNCCGGLPGQGPRSAHAGCGGECCCNSGNRLRGGSDRSIREIPSKSCETRSSSMPSGKSELSRTCRSVREACGCPMSSEFAERTFQGGCGYNSTPNSFLMRSERTRGGCGSCGGSPQPAIRRFQRFPGDQYQHHSVKLVNRRSCPTSQSPSCCHPCPLPLPACQRPEDCTKSSSAGTKGCCPCGGCGGAACSDNPGGGEIAGGCCGGSRPRGLPCKCKCQSCSDYHPLGGCGGQSCGKIYSCAGSGGGRCCFPRNYKRRSGPDCCGGADPNCGGCC